MLWATIGCVWRQRAARLVGFVRGLGLGLLGQLGVGLGLLGQLVGLGLLGLGLGLLVGLCKRLSRMRQALPLLPY